MMLILIKRGATRVDDIDQAWISQWSWYRNDSGYALRRHPEGKAPLRLHRLIMERMLGRPLLPTEHVDHINGNRLDNQRANLRVATASLNSRNRAPRAGSSSPYVGVALHGLTGKWRATIAVQKHQKHLGLFTTPEEAAWMRDQWAIAIHGEFARLNFNYITVTGRETDGTN